MKTTTDSKPFKSDRAARSAFTKSENAWKAARDARIEFEHANRPLPCVDDSDTGEWADRARATRKMLADLKATEEVARVATQGIYDKAKREGIYIHSYTFSDVNPTRDLIAANMD